MRIAGPFRIAARVLPALVVAGCYRPPAHRRQFAMPPPAKEYLVKETQLVNGAVSVRASIPFSPVGPKPAIIALIGEPRELVGAGFVAVTYTIHWHLLKRPTPPPAEQAVGKWVLASPSAAVLGEAYLREIVTTATEYVPAVIDWLETVPEVDATRIGIAGTSTNGFVTLQATAADRRIRAAVAIAACADYHRFLRDSSMGMEGKPLALDPTYDRWIRSQEIIRHPHLMVHAALFMKNRAGDQLVPVACADETAKILAAAYARAGSPERFRYLRVEGTEHGIAADEPREALAWFQEWLQ